jgi:predicted negative regulator of RcsB-dependent stress response
MESDATQSGGLIAFLAWVEENKQRLIIGGVAVVVAFFAIFLFFQYQAQKEVAASEALSNVRLPYGAGNATPPGTLEALAKVAADYPGSQAAARAMLISAGILFSEARSEKDFAKAEQLFAQVAREYPESQWVAQANLGVAATLAAQGKTADATTKYEEVRRRFANSAIIEDAKLALARLYEKSKPEDAFKLYEELTKDNANNVLGMEAKVRQDLLLKARPELAKLREPVVPPPSATPPIQITPVTNRVMTAVSNAVTGVATNLQSITLTNRPAPSPGAPNPAPPK